MDTERLKKPDKRELAIWIIDFYNSGCRSIYGSLLCTQITNRTGKSS